MPRHVQQRIIIFVTHYLRKPCRSGRGLILQNTCIPGNDIAQLYSSLWGRQVGKTYENYAFVFVPLIGRYLRSISTINLKPQQRTKTIKWHATVKTLTFAAYTTLIMRQVVSRVV